MLDQFGTVALPSFQWHHREVVKPKSMAKLNDITHRYIMFNVRVSYLSFVLMYIYIYIYDYIWYYTYIHKFVLLSNDKKPPTHGSMEKTLGSGQWIVRLGCILVRGESWDTAHFTAPHFASRPHSSTPMSNSTITATVLVRWLISREHFLIFTLKIPSLFLPCQLV